MKIVVGLGNPGKKFEKTAHNIGFRVIDELAKENNFPDFNFSKRFIAEISEDFLNEEKIILAKPQAFMNESGQAVKKITVNHQITANSLFVVHDDIDLPLGEIKIVKNRGSAGHKGVESIIKELKTKEFVRVRVGVKPANNGQRTINNIEKFVLRKFAKKEEEIAKGVIQKAVEAMGAILKDGLDRAMTKYN